jgi:hypothetical protein
MKTPLLISLVLGTTGLASAADLFDRVDDALTFSTQDNKIRARISGTLDLEQYHFQQPAPAFIYSGGNDLFQPRLSLFLDAQLGPYVYTFVQSRFDRGFDPANGDLRGRVDEYAVRITPWSDGRVNMQLGQFASIVGNWNPRHLSWDNPFITAPLPYENLTGVWDLAPPRNANTLALWANVGAGPSTRFPIKTRSLSILWGPSYATGASLSGLVGKFDYAVEVKNAALASRPDSWALNRAGLDDPTTSARIGYKPSGEWAFGVSASEGSYLLNTTAANTLPPGYTIHNYREILVGQDAAWFWRDWEMWAEVFETRFQVPQIGDADTAAYYLESRYKFNARTFLSVRWNQQLFATVANGTAAGARWGSNIWRIDVGPTFRFSAHTQFKLQYSFQREDITIGTTNHLVAGQFTTRF